MFNNKEMAKGNGIDITALNLIQKGTEIKGDINCNGDIRIDGILLGNLISNSKLVVGSSGSISGDIICKNADIAGEIKASITTEELLQLKSSATVIGDIKTNKLSIEPGALFTGSCKMGAVVKNISQTEKTEKKGA